MIAVCGGQTCEVETADIAEAVGREIARAGAVLVCGGLGGVMEAACRGAADAGGTSIGILPGSDPGSANEWVTYAIPTGIGFARNSIVVGCSQAVIAIDGEFGTLSEIAYAAKMEIPIVGIGTWSLSHHEVLDPIEREDDPVRAVEMAIERAREFRRLVEEPLG